MCLDYARALQGASQGPRRLGRPCYFGIALQQHGYGIAVERLQRPVLIDVHEVERQAEFTEGLRHLRTEVAVRTGQETQPGCRGQC